MRAVKIDTSGQATLYLGPITLDVLQSAVDGNIEAVTLKSDEGEFATMYLNEEGKLLGLLGNPVATFLATRYGLLDDVIVGNVIIVGPPNNEGEDTSLSDNWARLSGLSPSIL